MRTIAFMLLALLLVGAGLSPAISAEAGNVTTVAFTCDGTTDTALAARTTGGRMAVLIVNDGTVDVWLGISDAAAVANVDLPLDAGSSYYIAWNAVNFYTGAITCITAGSNAVLSITEWFNQ